MEKLYTNYNNNILEEMKKIVDTCNKNEMTIREITFINNSFDVCKIKEPQKTDGLLSVELKVVLK